MSFNIKDCPSCGRESAVIDSRPSKSHGGIRRRRKCPACNRRWSTIEVSEDELIPRETITNLRRSLNMAVGLVNKLTGEK